MTPQSGQAIIQEYRDRGFEVGLTVDSTGFILEVTRPDGSTGQHSMKLTMNQTIQDADFRRVIDYTIQTMGGHIPPC